jgi:hypothetical protein
MIICVEKKETNYNMVYIEDEEKYIHNCSCIQCIEKSESLYAAKKKETRDKQQDISLLFPS